MTDFAEEVAALTRDLDVERTRAVARLRSVEEAWARASLGLAAEGDLVALVRRAVEHGVDVRRARDAITHLAEAEQWQWEIGTWSTGSGEGLASMFAVRSLQLARAWLLSACAAVEAHAAAEARRLAAEVRDDPNDVAERYRADVETLLARMPA
jgi:hypothetical protein